MHGVSAQSSFATLRAELGLAALLGAHFATSNARLGAASAAMLLVKLGVERGLRWPFTPVVVAAIAKASGVGGVVLPWCALLLGAAFSSVFPQPMGIPPPTGPSAVAYVDVLVESPTGMPVNMRIYYPTPGGTVGRRGSAYFAPLLQPWRTCSAMMAVGAPPPLNRRPFRSVMFQHMRLLSCACLPPLPSPPGAPVRPRPLAVARGARGAPALVFSHGLTAGREQYTGLLSEYASHGVVVLALEHDDGSAAIARYPSGGCTLHSSAQKQLEATNPQAYVWSRREQVEHRAVEACAALDLLRALSDAPDAAPGQIRSSPRGRPSDANSVRALLSRRIDRERIGVMGHSMGAATAAAAACRARHVPRACILLDTALDWTPDEAVRHALVGAETDAHFTPVSPTHATRERAVRTLSEVPTLALYSEEWLDAGIGHPRRVREHLLAGEGFAPGSVFVGIRGVGHVGLSDIPALLPVWLATGLKFTREATPHEACARLRSLTLRFLARHMALSSVQPPTSRSAAGGTAANHDSAPHESSPIGNSAGAYAYAAC